MRSKLGHLVFSFSGWKPGRVRGTGGGEGNNIQKGVMKMPENLMNAISVGMC